MRSVDVPGLNLRYLDFKWDEQAFATLEKGGDPARDGAGPTLELRSIDVREVFTNLNVVAEAPPGKTYCQVPAVFNTVDTTAGRLAVALTEGKGTIDVNVHYGDREARVTLARN